MSYFFQENQWGERYIESLNRHAFAGMPSAQYFDRYLDLNFSQDDTLFVIVGSDSGLLISHVIDMPLGRGSRIAFVEPDELFDFIKPELTSILGSDGFINSTRNAKKISLHKESEWRSQLFGEADQNWLLAGQVCLLQSQACQVDYLQTYLAFFRNIRATIEECRVDAVARLGSKIFISTQLYNAADNIYPLRISPEFGKDRTAIILGGSPSLDLYIDWIVENREKLFVVAVSRLCAKLSELSLMPDLLISIDPFPFSYDVCKHGVLWKDVPLVSSFHVVPKLLQEWQGPKLYLGNRLPWNSEDNAIDVISANGPTVSHTAAVVASQLGFTTILLCGVDLCYGSNLNTHAKNSPESAFQKLPSMCDAQVETYSGRMAGTSAGLLHTCNSLEIIGQGVNEFADVLFNISEDAAKLDSIKYIDINDVTLPQDRPDFSNFLSNIRPIDYLDNLRQLSQQLHQAKKGFRLIRNTCKRAKSIIVSIYANQKHKKSTLGSTGLDQLDKIMEKNAGIYINTIRQYASVDFYTLRKPSGFDEMQPDEMEAWIGEYYKIISTAAKDFLRMIENLEKRIEIRKHEYSEHPDIKSLLHTWTEENSQGRVLSIGHQLSLTATDRDRELLKEASRHFVQFISETNTDAVKQLKSLNEDINNCMRSLIFLFNNKSKVELESLSRNLHDATEWPYNALYLFTLALTAELDRDYNQALTKFNSVIDLCTQRLESGDDSLLSMQRIIEESLVRMTQINITIGNHDSACTTLGTLCEMLPQYIMSYASLLKLTGNSSSAIELLDFYIENYPENWRAAVLKADIYQSLGDSEQARQALKHSENIRSAISIARTRNQQKQAA